MVTILYTVSLREVEMFEPRTLLLHIGGGTSFAERRRVDDVQYHSFRDACKGRGFLANDADLRPVQPYAFRSSFVSLTHSYATILASCTPSSPLDLHKNHHDMFITNICNRFRRHSQLHGGVSDALVCEPLKVRDHPSDMVTAPFSTFGLPTSREDLAPLATDSE